MEAKDAKTDTSTRTRLQAQLEGVVQQLQAEGEISQIAGGGDFLDVAQDVEQQELAHLVASRLAERAHRLRSALTRLQDGEYGVCEECGAPIPPKRLAALPDTTTCVACQDRLERVGSR